MKYKTDTGRILVEPSGDSFYRVVITRKGWPDYECYAAARSHYEAAKMAYRNRFGEDTIITAMI